MATDAEPKKIIIDTDPGIGKKNHQNPHLGFNFVSFSFHFTSLHVVIQICSLFLLLSKKAKFLSAMLDWFFSSSSNSMFFSENIAIGFSADDAMAIFLALRSPEVQVIGLTTIYGNVYTTLATRNALHLVKFYTFSLLIQWVPITFEGFVLFSNDGVDFLSLNFAYVVGGCGKNWYTSCRRNSCYINCKSLKKYYLIDFFNIMSIISLPLASLTNFFQHTFIIGWNSRGSHYFGSGSHQIEFETHLI